MIGAGIPAVFSANHTRIHTPIPPLSVPLFLPDTRTPLFVSHLRLHPNTNLQHQQPPLFRLAKRITTTTTIRWWCGAMNRGEREMR
ncbi:hypothetical protein HanRHA438_Chr17g0819681 [Helianthus annuus]|nr:hypothetical protein HanRHA438_Chr17g0819681 [Helianthus annuus]